MTPSQLARNIDRSAANNEKNILAAIDALEDRIIELIRQIDTNKNGSIAGPSRTLAQARRIHREMIKEFNDLYSAAVIESSAVNYAHIDATVTAYIGTTYAKSTSATMAAMARIHVSDHQSLSISTQSKLNKLIIEHITNRKSKSQLITSTRAILSGSVNAVDKLGRPMSMYARVLAHDAMREYYSTASVMTANKAGINVFRYFGSLITDSRQWCVSHVNKTYTADEIAAFDNSRWAGKKAGSTMINRGGWQCRHLWIAELPKVQ